MDESYSLKLRGDQLDLTRWAIRVARNAIASTAEEGNFPEDDAITMIARLDDLEIAIYDKVVCKKCQGPCKCEGEIDGSVQASESS